MENKSVAWLWIGIVGVIIISLVLVGGLNHFMSQDDGKPTKIEFNEKNVNGSIQVEITLKNNKNSGPIDFVINNGETRLTKSFNSPSDQVGEKLIIGQESELSKGTRIKVLKSGQTVTTYTIQGEENTETRQI